MSEADYQPEQARHCVKLLMREAPITQFEIEYATLPKCEFEYGPNHSRSLMYLEVRREIYEGLRGVRDTLQVYIDQNSLGGGTSLLGLRFTNCKFGGMSGVTRRVAHFMNPSLIMRLNFPVSSLGP